MKSPGSALAYSPRLVFLELTQACDLACVHCRACAQPSRNPAELTTASLRALVDQLLIFPSAPTLVLTGGDPLKRPDTLEFVRYARRSGLEVANDPLCHAAADPVGDQGTAGCGAGAAGHQCGWSRCGDPRRVSGSARELRAQPASDAGCQGAGA